MKVIAVRRVTLAEPVPVYDVSVPGLENFKLANGPFIHNSKDISDALAAVGYGLTMRRELWAMHQIPLGQIPASIQELLKSKRTAKMEGKEDAKDNSSPQ